MTLPGVQVVANPALEATTTLEMHAVRVATGRVEVLAELAEDSQTIDLQHSERIHECRQEIGD
jgi:hypothetical protein